ncbi:MAG: alpha-amylase/4-alpha-glucanotransferase domain-containing protein [Promethearchaeota archaeon]
MDEKQLEGKSVNFPFVFHFHQPVDNFDWVFHDVYDKCYAPLLEQIELHPKVKFNLHFTGSLLEWYIDNKPEMIDTIGRLAKRGQIEILGGGYYEPIFAIIPREDRVQQMLMLRDLVKETFHLEVNGAWLSERVWEPHYPSFLREAGLSYIIVDDNHLRACGLTERDTFYSYTTEDEGRVITVFPINEPLRYLAPWKPAWKSIEYLRTCASSAGNRVVLFMSDAEKMGVWGTTHELCYVEGHPDDDGVPFIKALFDHVQWNLENASWLKTVTLTEYQKSVPARRLVYFPNSTYDKMEEWALPSKMRRKRENLRKSLEEGEIPRSEEILPFLKAGFWRYFVVKYPEVNNMHKKMLHVRQKIKTLESETGESPITRKAWREVYMSQANDCYWHGQFGGVYYAVFRNSVYHHLNNAENLLDTKIRATSGKSGAPTPRVERFDFFKDSREEVLVEASEFNFYISPNDGGCVFELDFRPVSYNVLNLMSRWEEAYHEPERVVIDKHRKSLGRIHFIPAGSLLIPYARERLDDLGDFAGGEHEVSTAVDGKTVFVRLSRDGTVEDPAGGSAVPFAIHKTVKHEDGSREFTLEVLPELRGPAEASSSLSGVVLAVDLPFFLSGNPATVTVEVGGKRCQLNQHLKTTGRSAFFRDEERGFQFQVDVDSPGDTPELWYYPIRTFSRMNERYERTHQGSNLVVLVNLSKLAGSGKPLSVRFAFEELGHSSTSNK